MTSIERDGNRAVVRPRRNIVANDIKELRQELKQLVDEGVNDMVIDLTGIQMIDSIGLGVLISAFNSLKKTGGSFAVVNASKDIYGLFSSMRLTQHFPVSMI